VVISFQVLGNNLDQLLIFTNAKYSLLLIESILQLHLKTLVLHPVI
jgi:hypothetical protein